MKKMIYLPSEKTTRLMSMEDILVQFEDLTYSKAREFSYIASMYKEYDEEDLIQEANLGLWQAFERYDDTKNFAFSTLAVTCIDNNMKRIIRDKSRKKREGDKDYVISLDEKRDDGEKESADNYNFVSGECFEDNFINSLLIEEINKLLTQREKLYLLVILKEVQAVAVAKELNISKGAVSKGVKKTKEKLKTLLKDIYEEEMC